MVAVGISYLLYPVYRCGYAHDIWPNAWKEIWNNFRRYSNSYLLKIVSEPDFLLLEDQSCATSSQGHDQEVYPLEISLDLVVSTGYIQWRAAARFICEEDRRTIVSEKVRKTLKAGVQK